MNQKYDKIRNHYFSAPPPSGEKSRELLETPEEDNQQPSLEREPSEGSTTSSHNVKDVMKNHERGTTKLKGHCSCGQLGCTYLSKQSLIDDIV